LNGQLSLIPERPCILTPDTPLSVIASNGPPRIPSLHGHTIKPADFTLIRQDSVFSAIEIQYVRAIPEATFGLSNRVATFGWQELWGGAARRANWPVIDSYLLL
jgi:hypothetical protein